MRRNMWGIFGKLYIYIYTYIFNCICAFIWYMKDIYIYIYIYIYSTAFVHLFGILKIYIYIYMSSYFETKATLLLQTVWGSISSKFAHLVVVIKPVSDRKLYFHGK